MVSGQPDRPSTQPLLLLQGCVSITTRAESLKWFKTGKAPSHLCFLVWELFDENLKEKKILHTVLASITYLKVLWMQVNIELV